MRHNNGVFELPAYVRNTWNLLTVKNQNLKDGNLMATAIRDNLQFPLNLIFVLEEPGDIGFISAGIFPKRKHNVVQGVYTKIGSKIENRWEGIIASKDLPYVVNPDKGYLVNCNNFLSTDRMEYGLSHAFTFNHRKVRISEMIEEVINNSRKITVDDMKRI
jgi:penicillin amidase